jgi:hypothetical protein
MVRHFCPESHARGGVRLYCLSLKIAGPSGRSRKFARGPGISAPGFYAPEEGSGSLA